MILVTINAILIGYWSHICPVSDRKVTELLHYTFYLSHIEIFLQYAHKTIIISILPSQEFKCLPDMLDRQTNLLTLYCLVFLLSELDVIVFCERICNELWRKYIDLGSFI